MDVQVIGLLRFSILTADPGRSWRVPRQGGRDDYEEVLFAEERLERRFRLFEAITLPSLDAQADRDFTVVAMTSKRMPRPWRRRLKALADGRETLRVMAFEPDGPVPRFARKAVDRLRRPADRVATFRLDDDDAIACDFVGALRAAAAAAEPGAVVSAAHGLRVRAEPGRTFRALPEEKANAAQGLAFVAHGQDPATVFSQGNHARIDPARIGPIASDAPSWIRTHHSHNDSRGNRSDPFARDEHAASPRLDGAAFEELVARGYPTLRAGPLWDALTS